MVKCPQCGMTYIEEDEGNRREHRAFHGEVLNGVLARPLATENLVWSGSDDRITVVTALSPKWQRVRARKTASRANRDLHYDAGLYHEDEPWDEMQKHIFLYQRRSRIIGLAVLEWRFSVWRCTWDEYAREEVTEVDIGPIWSVTCLWVLERRRRTGIARKLLNRAVRFLKTTMQDVGFYTPFTESGERFVRTICPAAFLIAK
jgi:GNAT superfamily N-acetyltransferase